MIRRIQILLALFLLLIAYTNTSAQSAAWQMANNEMKYWKLRARLIGDPANRNVYNGFLHSGLGSGMAIPFEDRKPLALRNAWVYEPSNLQPISPSKCLGQYIYGKQTYAEYADAANRVLKSGYIPIIDSRDGMDLRGIMHCGENPLIALGNYLAILGVENSILAQSGASRNENTKEIYYALKAIDRIDEEAETIYGMWYNNNGFLIRGDIRSEFALEQFGSEYDMVTSEYACNVLKEGIIQPKVMTDCESNKTISKYSAAMSQDELIGLLYGLAFVERNCLDWYNGVLLRFYAKEIITRLISYTRNANGTFVLRDPKDKKPVCRGPFAYTFSYPMVRFLKWQVALGPEKKNIMTQTLGFAIWKTWIKAMKENATLGTLSTAVISIFLPSIIQNEIGMQNSTLTLVGQEGFYNVDMALKMAVISQTMTKWNMGIISDYYNKQIYNLANAVYGGYSPLFTNPFYWRVELNNMDCKGPCLQDININGYRDCNYNYGGNVSPGIVYENSWYSGNRWGSGKKAYSWPEPKDLNGNSYIEYPALDYLLTYNFYKRNYFNTGYFDKTRKKMFLASYPLTANNILPLGNTSYPLVNKAVYSFVASHSTINPNGHVTLEAGSSITLNPGFEAKMGSVFNTTIKDYDCTPMAYSYNGMDYTLYKREDTSGGFTLLDFTDTLEIITTDTLDGSEETPPEYDSTLVEIVKRNDTIFINWNQEYDFDEDGNLIYIAGEKYSTDQKSIQSLQLYPNPSDGKISVSYTLHSKSSIKYIVKDLMGHKIIADGFDSAIIEEKGTHKHDFDLGYLCAGVYFIEFWIGEQKEVHKFLIY